MSKEQLWRIEDTQIIDLLQSNGFTCEHPQTKYIPGAIQIFTRSPEEDKDWYVTSCPIEFNKQYTLPDGHVIRSNGTSLLLMS